jgi:7SK snRNA methylphosphate capping enzyme
MSHKRGALDLDASDLFDDISDISMHTDGSSRVTDESKEHAKIPRQPKDTGSVSIDKKTFNTRAPIFGNYSSYYGCRLNNHGEQTSNLHTCDPRISIFKQYSLLFKDKRILDIGCNCGSLTISIAKALNPRYILGIDIDSTLVKKARHQVQFQYSIQKPHLGPFMTRSNIDLSNDSEESCFEDKDTCYFPISMPIVFGYIPILRSIPADAAMNNFFPMNIEFKCKNWIDYNPETRPNMPVDTILCLSITKWIHLNWGDHGIRILFQRAYNELVPGGVLILEPQPWSSYKKKQMITETHKRHYKEIKILPADFLELLFEIGFIASYRIPLESNRPIYIFKKPLNIRNNSDIVDTDIDRAI